MDQSIPDLGWTRRGVVVLPWGTAPSWMFDVYTSADKGGVMLMVPAIPLVLDEALYSALLARREANFMQRCPSCDARGKRKGKNVEFLHEHDCSVSNDQINRLLDKHRDEYGGVAFSHFDLDDPATHGPTQHWIIDERMNVRTVVR